MASCNLSAIVSVTGDCTNSGVGAFLVNILGSNPPYFYQSISPTFDPIATPLPAGVTSFGQTNLSPATYTYLIFDSCAGTPTQFYANVIISDGVCASLVGHSNTTCNSSNGSISASTNNELTSTDYFLYENIRGYITSANSINDVYVFQNLSAGTYYVTVNDGGGCTARTESCIVKESTPLDFGFYVVDNTGCNPTPTGKVFVTGITGFSPYIYQWSTGALTSSITGLTQGVYQLTLTDATGCQTSKSAVVNLAPQIGVSDYIPVSPTCTGSDGQITITITGGTAPFNYVASNGQSTITFDRTFSVTGLSSGIYTITVTDAGLCTKTFTYTLTAPNGFSILTVGIVNSTCNNSSGALSPINLVGGTPPFVYTLTYPSGNSIQQTINGFSNQFQGLSAGTYTLTISNAACSVTNTYTINNTIKFDVNTTVTGSTCDTNNGAVRISLTTGGTSPYTYYFTGQPPISNTSQRPITINNLFAGTYTLNVSDATNCTQTQTVVVPDTPSIDFVLDETDASNINNGQIQVYITDGPPPYTITWSNNVNGQTGLTLTNLSAGTYSVTIVDNNGCELSRSVTIYGFNSYGTYGLYDYCESTIEYNGITIQKKIPQMYSEGYYDLVSGENNCVLNGAVFYSEVTLAGVSAQTQFYTSTSLGDYPSDNQWFDAIRDALLSYPVIGNVIILPAENRITIQTNCSDQSLSLDNSQVTVALKISYDFSCVCEIPTPTPGPVINNCDMIYIQPSSEAYAYEFSSDTSSLLTISDYTYNSPSIAFTSSKLWLYSIGVNSSSIQEYDIQLNGFTAVLNRTLSVGFELGEAIGVKNNTTLVTTDTSTQSSYNQVNTNYLNYFVELNITNNSVATTNKSILSLNRRIIGNLVFSQNYSQMISLQVDDTNLPSVSYFLTVHETTNYNPLIECELTSIVGNPSGLFVDNGLIYLLTDDTNIYEISNTYPYTQTINTTIGGAGIPNSISQQTSCFSEELDLCYAECGGLVEVTSTNQSDIGDFETYVDIGSGVGVVEVTFQQLNFATFNTPNRYLIEWNGVIVADSLWVLNNTTLSNASYSNITGTTSPPNLWRRIRHVYLYCEGNGNTASGSLMPNTNWISIGDSFTNNWQPLSPPSEIADPSIPRSIGTPGQIGVVNNYPTPVSPSSYADLKLQFTKTSAGPNYMKVIVRTFTKGTFAFETTICP